MTGHRLQGGRFLSARRFLWLRVPLARLQGAGQPAALPRCSSARVRRIVYGEPSPDLGRQAERGEVVLGGLLVGNDPIWDCPDCDTRFGVVADDEP